jgi:hypothetical protein
MPKFLCVKGILFFSFWQSIFISILVAAGVITKLGPYTDSEHISLALTDALVCIEMPFFAIAHQYAFSTVDFVDKHAKYVARMPMRYAVRDAFGLKDVTEDIKATLRGEGMDYREYEPSEGFIHQGAGRDRRIRAGLRYSQGGKRKYWLPQPTVSTQPPSKTERRINKIIERVTGDPEQGEEVYAPLLPDQANDVVHLAPDLQPPHTDDNIFDLNEPRDTGFDLPFGDLDPSDEELFSQSKRYLFGDYNYPVVDVSSEHARLEIWVEEERILRDERGVFFSPILGPNRSANNSRQGYGATDNNHRPSVRTRHDSSTSSGSKDKGKGKGKVVHSTPSREVIIDKEQDRITDKSNGDVRLGWTKLGGHSTPVQPPRIRTLSNQGQAASTSGSPSSSSGSGSPQDRPPPTPRRDSDRPVLPPDAVDLVVEDPEAAHEESSHDRRRGEPAGLRKVYRRGYVVEDAEGRKEGEVEVEDAEEATPFAVGDDVDEVTQAEAVAVEDMVATVAATPPAHARVVVDDYPSHEENPWA